MQASGTGGDPCEVGHVLAGRDTCRPQPRVRRSRHVGDVVDVQRIDPDERRPGSSQFVRSVGGQKWVAAEVAVSTPVAREVGAKEDAFAVQVAGGYRVGTNCPPGSRDVGDHNSPIPKLLPRKPSQGDGTSEPTPDRKVTRL